MGHKFAPELINTCIPCYRLLVLRESLLQGHILALVELVLWTIAEGRSFKQTVVVVDVVGSTLVSVQERHIVVIQLFGQGYALV